MEITILILSILNFLQFIYNIKLQSNYSRLKLEKIKVEDEKESITSILPGDRVTCQQSLTWAEKYSFSVMYEAEVLDVSDKSVKIAPISFSEINTINKEVKKDPTYKDQILKFMNQKWVPRSDVSLIVDDELIRDKKISSILN